MMNITLLAAQAALADTLAGGNPTLTPVSGEAVFISFLNVLLTFARLVRKTLCLWNVSGIIFVPER